MKFNQCLPAHRSIFTIPQGAILAIALAVPALRAGTAQASSEAVLQTSQEYRTSLGKDRWSQLEGRLDSLNADIANRGLRKFRDFPERMVTGYAYEEFYDWDLYFENIYLSYYGISDYCFTNLRAFLSIQRTNGFISRMLQRQQTKQLFKPFLAQLCVLGSQQTGDFEWLRADVYPRLGKYLDRWMAYDNDNNGLPVWNSADASGMDNQDSRSGKIDSFQTEGVDLACYLYREMEAMAFLAGKLNLLTEQASWKQRSTALCQLINKTFWDEAVGFYFDRSERTGKLIRVKSVAGFIPIWAGVATPRQVERLVKEHLTNENEFWLKYPVSSYAKSEPDFYQGVRTRECNWRGPTWIPTNYMIMHGLMDYGYRDVAQQLADRKFRLVLDENKVTREFYDSDTGKGNGMNPFWGWSSLGYVMPLDLFNGYDPMKFGTPILPFLAHVGVTWPGHLAP